MALGGGGGGGAAAVFLAKPVDLAAALGLPAERSVTGPAGGLLGACPLFFFGGGAAAGLVFFPLAAADTHRRDADDDDDDDDDDDSPLRWSGDSSLEPVLIRVKRAAINTVL